MLGMEEGTNKRRPFFTSPDELLEEEYYDEQLPGKKRRLTPEQVILPSPPFSMLLYSRSRITRERTKLKKTILIIRNELLLDLPLLLPVIAISFGRVPYVNFLQALDQPSEFLLLKPHPSDLAQITPLNNIDGSE